MTMNIEAPEEVNNNPNVEWNPETYTIQMDEYALHEFVVTLSNFADEFFKSHVKGEIVEHFQVVSSGDDNDAFTEEMVCKWTFELNQLFRHIHHLDPMIHDDAEYTC